LACYLTFASLDASIIKGLLTVDEKFLMAAVCERLRTHILNAPLAQTG
jgi:hypothetical protein